MDSTTKDVANIIAVEIAKLHDAAMMRGLSLDEVRKLEILARIAKEPVTLPAAVDNSQTANMSDEELDAAARINKG